MKMSEKENSCLGHYPTSRVSISEEDLSQFKFETAIDDGQGVHVNEEELRKYVALKVGVTESVVDAVINAELEYLERCGIVLAE